MFNLTVDEAHTFYVGESGWLVHNTSCSVDVRKFSDYVFKAGADHGKDAIFRAAGYGAEDSAALANLYQAQAEAKYAVGKYVSGSSSQYGQKITIVIDVPGVGSASGRVAHIDSGWLIRSDGTVTLSAPVSGKGVRWGR